MATYYVKWDATGAGNGTSWENAYTTISAAIAAHTATGDIIEISGGTSGHTYNEVVDFRYGGSAQLIGSSASGHSGKVTLSAVGINSSLLYITGKTVKNIDLLCSEYASRYSLVSNGGTLEGVRFVGGQRAFLHNTGVLLLDKCIIKDHSDSARSATVIAGTVTMQRSTYRKNKGPLSLEPTATFNAKNSAICENITPYTVNLSASPSTVNIDNCIISGNGSFDSDFPAIRKASGGTLNVTSSLLQPHPLFNTPCCSVMTVNTGNVTSAPHFTSHGGGKAYISFGADCDCRDLGTGGHLPGEGTWDGFQALIDYANPKGIYCYVAMERIHKYTAADWDRIRAWEAAGNEAHNHTFYHDGMNDVLNVGVLVVTGPAGSAISLTIDRVDDTDSDTWTGSFVMKEGGTVVSTIDVSKGSTAGVSPFALRAEIIKRAGWTAEPPSGQSMNYERPIVSLADFAEQSAASGVTLKGDLDAYMWMDYVEPKVLIESELGHECNFCTYPGGQSTPEGEAWILNAANFKGLTTPYLGGRKAAVTSGSFTWRDPRVTSGTVAKTGCQVGQINGPYLPTFLAAAGDVSDRADAHLCWLAGIGGIAMYYIHYFSDITEAKVQEFVDAIAENPAVEVMLPRDLIQLIRTETDLDGDGLRFGRTVAPDFSDYHTVKGSPCIRAGIDVGLTTDADGNAIPTGAGFDIGPYFYRPEVDSGYSPWCKCDAAMPVDGQVFKSHALPISAKKVTVFPGVASAAQINEAAG